MSLAAYGCKNIPECILQIFGWGICTHLQVLSWNGWCGENSCGSGSEVGCGGREQSLVLDSLGSAVVKYFHNAARGGGSAED